MTLFLLISGTCAIYYFDNSLQLHIYKAWIRYLLQYLIFFAFLFNCVNCSSLFVAQVPFKTSSKLFTTAVLSTVHDSFIPGCFHRRILGMPNPIVN